MNGSNSGETNDNQMSMEQMDHMISEMEAESILESIVEQEYESSLLAELDKTGVKYSIDALEFITRDGTGQIVWLEKGNEKAGLEHILNRHANDFQNKLGIEKSAISGVINKIVNQGIVVSNKTKDINGRKGYERIYKYNNKYYFMAGIGSNGFIVTIYPINNKGEE